MEKERFDEKFEQRAEVASNEQVQGQCDATSDSSLNETRQCDHCECGHGEGGELESLRSENEQLKERVEELERNLRELQNAARIIKANFENYRLDAERQLRDATKGATLRVIKTLLPILDDLKRAFRYFENSKDLEEFHRGVSRIYEKFLKTLENEGLRVIDTSGKFDPFLHEAFEREEREDVEEYTILETIEDGYTFNGTVVKPAKVRVALKPRRVAEKAKGETGDGSVNNNEVTEGQQAGTNG